MGGRILLITTTCLMLLAAPVQADPAVALEEPPSKENTCASVEKDTTSAQEASVSAQVPDPREVNETALDLVLPKIEHFNGIRLALHASPHDCV